MFAFAWMLGALASFSLMAIGARELSDQVPVFQSLSFRSLIGLIILSCLSALSDKKQQIVFNRLGLHTVRNIFHLIASMAGFSVSVYCR